MNRVVWTESITKAKCPPWPCPSCGKGVLTIVPKSLSYNETKESKSHRQAVDWDPTWVSYVFTCWVECRRCHSEVAISGVGYVDPAEEAGAYGLEDYFQPKLLVPMPDIIAIPDECPDPVRDSLRAAFELYWIEQSAAASRIRVAIERLMDHLKIKKRYRDKNGTMRDMTLHERIKDFAAKNPAIGNQLMALKWLGNTASHVGKVTRAELLDAFEIMEHALDELLAGRTAKVATLAKRLTKLHGPRRR